MLLWQNIARRLDLEYTVDSCDLEELLDGVSNSQIDVGVLYLTIPPERETILVFSHSFYETYLSIAVKKQGLLTNNMPIASPWDDPIELNLQVCAVGKIFEPFHILSFVANNG